MLTLDWVWLVGLGVSALLVLLTTRHFADDPIRCAYARCSFTGFALIGFFTISSTLWGALIAAATGTDELLFAAVRWAL